MTQMPSTPRRTRNSSFCHNNDTLCTPTSSASQDAACGGDANSCDVDLEDTSDKESDGEEDDSEKEDALAPSDQSFGLGQAGLSLIVKETPAGIAAVADMGMSLAQPTSNVAGIGTNDEEDDDDMYNAVDDIPDDYEEDMNDTFDVGHLLSKEELPSDPINDMPMRSIEIEDEADGYLPKGVQGHTVGASAYSMDFQAQDELNLLSPTSMSKLDFSSSFPEMSGYEAECKSINCELCAGLN